MLNMKLKRIILREFLGYGLLFLTQHLSRSGAKLAGKEEEDEQFWVSTVCRLASLELFQYTITAIVYRSSLYKLF